MAKIKKIVASLAAIATISAVGICASAYSNPTFDFIISSNSGSWSNGAVKENILNYAGVHTTSGTVSSQSPMFVTIYSSKNLNNRYHKTDTGTLRNNADYCTLTYQSSYDQDETYYLHGES